MKVFSILKNNWHKYRLLRQSVRSIGAALVLFIGFDFLFPFNVSVPYSTVVLDADGEILQAFLSRDEKWRMYARLDEVSPDFKKAILFKEDKYFYFHPGVNPIAIVKAFGKNITENRRASGASTITMQTVRLLRPRKRTYLSKFAEIWNAFQLEWHYSKDEILELYINLLPYGGNVEGLRAAALLYFQRSTKLLSLGESVALCMAPNRPTSLKLGVYNERIETARNRWLDLYQAACVFPDSNIAAAKREPLNAHREPPPRLAPQFALRMAKQYRYIPIIKTLLKQNLQTRAQQLTHNYIRRISHLHITNASVIIVNNRTKAVEAYVGSADFENPQAQGQVDGAAAYRSPGSALKPLLYALSFDQGLLTPKTIVDDVPVNYYGYMPENYDQTYLGQVSVETALGKSLNIPAVRALEQLGKVKIIKALEEAHFKQIERDAPKLGLSLILGGCGVNLEEMANLYASFANNGRYSPLRWSPNDSLSTGKPLITESSAYMLSKILSDLKRPDLPFAYQNTTLPRIAWKTGTSYGRRDGWSIGYNPEYTVAVWCGNFDGSGTPALSGAEIATPLMIQIFDAIGSGYDKKWFQPPVSHKERYVCSLSGLVPDTFCRSLVLDAYIPAVSSNQKCAHRQAVWVNSAKTMSYCMNCKPEDGAIQVFYDRFSPEIVAYNDSKKIPYQKAPSHNPKCSRVLDHKSLKISSPNDRAIYYLEKKQNQKLQLACQSDQPESHVSWFINRKFLAVAPAAKPLFFQPDTGRCVITCTDDRGESQTIEIRIIKE